MSGEFGCPKCRPSLITCKYCDKPWSDVESAMKVRALAQSKKVKCKLCNCEGVAIVFATGGSVQSLLCKEHLEGYRYACAFLPDETVRELVRLVRAQLNGAKEADDNGKSK